MKKILVVALIGIMGVSFGQDAWDSGSISFSYGSPFPSESVSYSGSFLSTDIPTQGVGGFNISQGDTNFLSMVAYEIEIIDSDTLADIFAIILQDTIPIEAGFHTVGFGTDALKLFLWMEDVDPAMVTALIDTNFTIDSLDILDPYLSLSGQIEISGINQSTIQGNFAGAMVNTSLDFIVIGDGLFSLDNTLPELAYTQGVLGAMLDTNMITIDGELNPLMSEGGVGSFETHQGDTLTTMLFAYQPNSTGEALVVYGIMYRALADDYPDVDNFLGFNIGSAPDELPMAVPFYLENASMDQLTQLLTSETIPSLEDFENLFLPAAQGISILGINADETAYAALNSMLMINTQGTTHMLMENWSLNNGAPTSINPSPRHGPVEKSMVGHAYPNPFNSSTIIPFEVPEASVLDMVLYNVLGQQVFTHRMGAFQQGRHLYHLELAATKISAGVYYYQLRSQHKSLGTGSFIYLK